MYSRHTYVTSVVALTAYFSCFIYAADMVSVTSSAEVLQTENTTSDYCTTELSETCVLSNDTLLGGMVSVASVHNPSFNQRGFDTTSVLIISSNQQSRRINELLNTVRAYMEHYSTIVVFPVIGLAGLVGNSLSIVILIKSGLKKSSNILLFALAVADSFCLFGALNVGQIARFLTRRVPYGIFMWEFSRDTCFILSILSVSTSAFNMLGRLVSAAICTFITLERIIAVYFPMHFATIVTPTRAWIAVVFPFLLWTPYVVYLSTLYSVQHLYMALWDTHVGYLVLVPSPLLIYLDFYVVTPLGKYVSLIVISVGSILIAVRVNTAQKKRQEMVSATALKKPGTSRLTPTLLAVCVVFILSQGLGVIISLVGLDTNGTDNYNVLTVIGIVVATAQYTNSSSNFIIYTVFNKKFRDILRKMCFHK